jgi:hypothetical protein
VLFTPEAHRALAGDQRRDAEQVGGLEGHRARHAARSRPGRGGGVVRDRALRARGPGDCRRASRRRAGAFGTRGGEPLRPSAHRRTSSSPIRKG